MKKFSLNSLFGLESGSTLQGLEVAYHTIGHPNSDCSNVIWICHALTANSNPEEWWDGLVGENKFFNPREHYIICANVIGSCYGSTGPTSIRPQTGQPYYQDFPLITIRDIVKSLDLLREHLGIEKIHTLIGGSMGGFQAMEWAIQSPDRFQNLILLATAARHSPWGIAFNESQRMAIATDASWGEKSLQAASKGLATARSIALLSYRNNQAYDNTQPREENQIDQFNAASYQQYQGKKLTARFDAYTYFNLTKTMDSHDVSRGRISTERSLGLIKASTTIIGIKGDILFPTVYQKELWKYIKNAKLYLIDSPYGHDGFLIETKQIEQILDTKQILSI